nr:unnamed protein product [Callosobruchus analis]
MFSSSDGIKLQDYLLKLGPIINPRNILFCSRISNNRICVFLSSKSLVDASLEDPAQIELSGEIIKACRLITPSDRLVISNVSPTVPHTVLSEKVSQLGLKLVSPITFLRIGDPRPWYSHILSFRRKVYIEPNQSSINLPESLEIIHDAVTYCIFLSLDSHKCFKCNRQGHIASQCPMPSQMQINILNTSTQLNIQQETIITQQTDKQQTTHITSDTATLNKGRLDTKIHPPHIQETKIRIYKSRHLNETSQKRFHLPLQHLM